MFDHTKPPIRAEIVVVFYTLVKYIFLKVSWVTLYALIQEDKTVWMNFIWCSFNKSVNWLLSSDVHICCFLFFSNAE